MSATVNSPVNTVLNTLVNAQVNDLLDTLVNTPVNTALAHALVRTPANTPTSTHVNTSVSALVSPCTPPLPESSLSLQSGLIGMATHGSSRSCDFVADPRSGWEPRSWMLDPGSFQDQDAGSWTHGSVPLILFCFLWNPTDRKNVRFELFRKCVLF